jgi:hypothetical protein
LSAAVAGGIRALISREAALQDSLAQRARINTPLREQALKVRLKVPKGIEHTKNAGKTHGNIELS